MIDVNVDATAFGSSGCILNFKRTTIGEIVYGDEITVDPLGGYKNKALEIDMVYGIAVHKYVHAMYQTNGHIPTARAEAFNAMDTIAYGPVSDRKGHLGDKKHLFGVCFNTWEEYVKTDSEFEVLQIPVECFNCKGRGVLQGDGEEVVCPSCKGQMIVTGPATERNFRILFYEDGTIRVWLCGTIDRIGKMVGGPFCIGDWKTTGSFDIEDYLYLYWLSRQLRIYVLACKLEAQQHPDSILGKIGATKMGAFIDGIFLKKSPNDTKFKRSDVMIFPDEDIEEFKQMLTAYCVKLSDHVKANYWPREGMLNGSCNGNFGKPCKFFPVCKSGKTLGAFLLNRDFARKPYDPLNFQD